MPSFFFSSWTWLFITVAGFALCAFLPIFIKDDELRRKINWYVLIPVSLVLMFYAYPVGMEVFGRLAVQ